jgi:Na+-transporting methylmalonyl-CoA/oxaloacetate decarboxylase gamma subunit
MYKFILTVAVVGLSACAKTEEVQSEATADSTAVVVDSTTLNTDSVKVADTIVVAPTEGPAAK